MVIRQTARLRLRGTSTRQTSREGWWGEARGIKRFKAGNCPHLGPRDLESLYDCLKNRQPVEAPDKEKVLDQGWS